MLECSDKGWLALMTYTLWCGENDNIINNKRRIGEVFVFALPAYHLRVYKGCFFLKTRFAWQYSF